MKILFITSYGFSDRMRNFMEFILARIMAKSGWKVFAVARPEKELTENFTTDGVRVFKTQNMLRGFFHLAKLMAFERPDVIHIFNQRNNPLAIMAAGLNKIFGIPLVFTEYGLLHDHYLVKDRDNPLPISLKFNEDGAILSFGKIFRNKNIVKNAKNYLFHLPLSSADKIVFVSRHNIELAEKMGLKKSLYLPYIFDEKRWPPADSGNDFKKSENENLILFIGQMKLRKGWDVILEAVSYIDKGLNPKLVFITSSYEKEPAELSSAVEKLKIRDRIIFLGKVSNEKLEEAYRASELVAIPSRYEGFGLPVIEAWEMQKPVVASDVVAVNEHVKNGYNGLLVPPENPKALAEAMERVLKDKNLRGNLIQGGNQTLKTMKSEEFKNKWFDFYKLLIENKNFPSEKITEKGN